MCEHRFIQLTTEHYERTTFDVDKVVPWSVKGCIKCGRLYHRGRVFSTRYSPTNTEAAEKHYWDRLALFSGGKDG